MIDQNSDFAKALRTLFRGAEIPDEAIVDVELTGGGQVQIGDYTWDSEPIEIVVSAYVPRPHKGVTRYWQSGHEHRFYDLPSLWAVLQSKETS